MDENNQFGTHQNNETGQQQTTQPDFGPQPNNQQPGFGPQMNNQQPDFGPQPNNQQPVFGQQMNNQQPNFQQQPGYVPGHTPVGNPGLQYQKPKRNNAALIAGIAAAFVLLIVLVSAVIIFKNALFRETPERMLAQGIETMAKEMLAYSSSISEEIGAAAIQELKKETPSHVNMDLSLTLPNVEELKNVDIEIDAVTDTKNKKAEFELGIGAYGFTMPVGNIVADNHMLYFNLPMLAEDVYSIDLANLGDDFNNSAWARLMDTELPEDYSLELFPESSEKPSQEDAELIEIAAKHAKLMRDIRTITAISEKKTFKIGDKTVKCGGVTITLPKEEANNWLEGLSTDIMDSQFYQNIVERILDRYEALGGAELEDYRKDIDEVMETIFGLRFEQDFVINIYMDAKARIVNISTPGDIAVSGTDAETFSVDIYFTGEERALDEIDGEFCLKDGDMITSIGIVREAKVNETIYKEDLALSFDVSYGRAAEGLVFRYENEWNYDEKSFDMEAAIEIDGEDMTFTADGGFTDIVKGESYTIRINNAALSIDGEDLMLLCGSIKNEPFDEEIEIPSSSVSLFDMTESEIEGLLYGTPSLYY